MYYISPGHMAIVGEYSGSCDIQHSQLTSTMMLISIFLSLCLNITNIATRDKNESCIKLINRQNKVPLFIMFLEETTQRDTQK